MKSSIRDIPKKRGRPSQGGRKPGIMLRWPTQDIARLDKWIARQADEPSRPEAIRRLVEQALDGSMPPKHSARMAPLKSEPPGMERDSHGHAIPLKARLPEDRAKAKRAKVAQPKPRKK